VDAVARQVNGRDHLVHRGSSAGSGGQIYSEQFGPRLFGQHVRRDHGSGSSVSSVASSAKIASSGHVLNRTAHHVSSSNDTAVAANQLEEVYEKLDAGCRKGLHPSSLS